ncbi:unnamed protein product [Brachionus calyciflorus]|uniref:Reverse transcriptase domain-containing protein n=1 Tax=Brachionus calyciflorus TaxID=104777 RepID=A0A813UG80_9BILA|nr:unnamed protein product [Brachionus calyciflorus]
MYEIFLKSYEVTRELFVPKKKSGQNKEISSWMNSDVKNMINEKYKAWKRYSSKYWKKKHYKFVRDKCNKACSKVKKHYEKIHYKIKKNKQCSRIRFKVANCLSDYFSSIFNSGDDEDLPIFESHTDLTFDLNLEESFSPSWIKHRFERLDEGKAYCPDNSGSKYDVSNYRPVSITSILCKVMKRIINDKLLDYFTSNKLICKEQLGFVPGKCCTTNLLETLDIITLALSEGKIIDRQTQKKRTAKQQAKNASKKPKVLDNSLNDSDPISETSSSPKEKAIIRKPSSIPSSQNERDQILSQHNSNLSNTSKNAIITESLSNENECSTEFMIYEFKFFLLQ